MKPHPCDNFLPHPLKITLRQDEILRSIGPHSFVPELRWRPRHQLRRSELPAGLTEWLFDPGSLTRRLCRTCRGRFRVHVLGQYWARPSRVESRTLELNRRGYVWVREVHLLCDEQPWVFARTLIPLPTLRGRGLHLTRLGSRPLGEVLFTDPHVRRGTVEVACIQRGQHLHRRAFGGNREQPAPIWGRRSIFHIDDRPLLVCEIFLPDLPISNAISRPETAC